MLYHAYEMTHAAISPMRAAARLSQEVMRNPLNPMGELYGSRAFSAALEMFINATRRYGKPEWEIDDTPRPEAVLFNHWLTALRLRGGGLKTPPSTCDTACVVELFTDPDEAFGKSAREREELRDQLLLEALIVAVEEAEQP